MNILILGSGGREHAIAWKVAQSNLCTKLFVGPGNAGTSSVAENVALNPNDFEAVSDFCLNNAIEMVVVGPEDPLVNGIKDYFKANPKISSIAVIGPDAKAAQMEGSKDFSKEFMAEFGIPTAAYKSFTPETLEEGKSFLETLKPPFVLKADGLAAGKGVLILEELDEAKLELESMLSGKFGDASSKVVIEEFLDGIEFSVFALTDGKDYKILPVAKDYKRIGEGDIGLNTGGMGAVSPVPFVDDTLMQKVEERIIKPTIKGIGGRGMDYSGFVFFGLISVKGEPFVIEYNVRMGDPETEVVIPRIQGDLLKVLASLSKGELGNTVLNEDPRFATTVMTVSEGYPEAYEKGKSIAGLDAVSESIIFHAGTKQQEESIVTNGGRVMAFTSYGESMKEALNKSYSSIKKVCFDGITFRKDIGFDL
jgi:phosphoribosylamine--glycine ligase